MRTIIRSWTFLIRSNCALKLNFLSAVCCDVTDADCDQPKKQTNCSNDSSFTVAFKIYLEVVVGTLDFAQNLAQIAVASIEDDSSINELVEPALVSLQS